MLRIIVAVPVGLVVAAVLFQLLAALVLLAMHGIPLGSEAVRPGPAMYAALLAAGGLAAWTGAVVALRIARGSRLLLAVVMGTALTAAVIAGFSKPTSQWPRWFPPALAAAGVVGVALATRRARGRDGGASGSPGADPERSRP